MKLAIYDFDGTYLESEALKTVYMFWKECGLENIQFRKTWRTIRRRYIFNKFHLFGWSKAKFRANAMALTADLFRSVDRMVLDEFLKNLYIKFKPMINQEMKEQLLKDKNDGYFTILLSGNFNIILEPFFEEGFDDVIGTNVLNNNHIKETKDIEIIIHDLKSRVIMEKYPHIDFVNSKAYADSYYDLPILELVGKPICVNPDLELLRIAKKRNYSVLFLGEYK